MSYGLDSWSNSILGEGTIWPIPPDLSGCGATCRSSQCREGNIDWDGEVRCRSEVTVGGFNTGNIQVKVGFSTTSQNLQYINAISVGLYHSNHLSTNTNISPNETETHCSCEIGYRLLLRYSYADGLWYPMTAVFSYHSSSALFELTLPPNCTKRLICIQISTFKTIIPGCPKMYFMNIYYNMYYMLIHCASSCRLSMSTLTEFRDCIKHLFEFFLRQRDYVLPPFYLFTSNFPYFYVTY